MVDLSTYRSVRTALFVRIQIDEYRTTANGSFTSQVLRFSDHNQNFTIDGENYIPLGNLLSITASNRELRPSPNTVSVTLSGIPNSSIAEILYSNIKGSPVKIYRAFFNVSNNAQIGNTIGRFIGSVNNTSLEEEYEVLDRTASNTLLIECSSNIDMLSRKTAGRRTNPESMKRYYPTDISFDRIPNLNNTTFNFGAPG